MNQNDCENKDYLKKARAHNYYNGKKHCSVINNRTFF